MTARADGSPGRGSSEPAPAVVRRPAPLLERDDDLAALRELLDAARAGNGAMAVVEGTAGIGKTRLLAETRAAAGERDFRILSARGGELERGFAFGIVRQLFEPLLAAATAEEREELLAGAADLAAPLFGEAALVEGAAGGEASFAVLHGLYWLAANAAAARPTLLLVDDLQCADRPSLRFLGHMARRLDGLPLVLAVASRPPEQSEHAALLGELLADPAALALAPETLHPESVALLAREVFGAEPDAEFCVACHDATGGNPLYLRAVLFTLADEGVPPTAASVPSVRDVGPEPVARAVALRLGRLPAEAGELARMVSIVGDGAQLDQVGELAGLDRAAAAAAAVELARGDLVRLGPPLEFTHPVVRTAVYESMGAGERAVAHRRAAGFLAAAGAEPEQPASHLLLVPPAGDPLVGPVMRAAARRALATGAADEAAVYLRRALAEPPAAEERGAILAELGTIERSVDLPAAIEHLREAFALVEERRASAEVALELGRGLGFAGFDSAEAIEVWRAAIDRAGDERPDLAEVATAELVNACWTERAYHPTAKELIGAVREDTLAGGEGSDVLRALLAHHEVRRGVDRARAAALARRALASGSLAGHSTQAIYYALDALRAANELDAALAGYEQALAAARRRGDLLNVGGLLGFRGWLLTDKGELRSAEPDVRESLEFSAEHGTPVHVMYSAAFLAVYLLERGEVDEAEAVLARAGMPDRLPENFHFALFLGARGRLRLAQRRPDAALADLEALRQIAEALELTNAAEWPWRSQTATVLLALERDDEARALAEEELELARRWGTPRPIGIALRTLGLAEGGEAGEERLREAVEVLAASPARLEHAKALVELGAVLRRTNRRREAREPLGRGIDLAGRCGARALAERGNEELAATGARPRSVVASGIDSLTASERRVAQLAAGDLSNREIAQALFVSVKTVELHLSHVYRKLGIGSRRQLATALLAPEASLSGISA